MNTNMYVNTYINTYMMTYIHNKCNKINEVAT